LSRSGELACSYVLPLRSRDTKRQAELTTYLRQLSRWCAEVVVVDGSSVEVFALNAQAWGGSVRHIPLLPEFASLNGKAAGVNTGIAQASYELIVIADDDVRYERPELERIVDLLEGCELVRPQNYFCPLPWHARWDTARILLNRAVGADFPGTLAVRRSRIRAIGGYDGDVLFENLELIRTVEAGGGRTISPLDLYVRRLPPSARHFWGQRTRQAYDDFAIPPRMALWLIIIPAVATAVARRRPGRLAAGAALASFVAEGGRNRAGGRRIFPATSSLLASVWMLERGVCSWLAVIQRLRYGGVRYGDSVIRVAAHSRRKLRRRATARTRQSDLVTFVA
jgi:glycosyl transferase family 2